LLQDSLLVIEKYKSGFLPPGDFPFEDLSTTDGSTSNISQTGLGVSQTKPNLFGGSQSKENCGFEYSALSLSFTKKATFPPPQTAAPPTSHKPASG
jgi:hypothetical protein